MHHLASQVDLFHQDNFVWCGIGGGVKWKISYPKEFTATCANKTNEKILVEQCQLHFTDKTALISNNLHGIDYSESLKVYKSYQGLKKEYQKKSTRTLFRIFM